MPAKPPAPTPDQRQPDPWQLFLQGTARLVRKPRATLNPTPATARATKAAPKSALIAPDRESQQLKQPPRVVVQLAPTQNGQSWQLEKNILRAIKIGRVPLEARLDLHGFTKEQAASRLSGFILQSARLGYRCVLVITGKGGLTQPDSLRALVPGWLRESELASQVIGAAPAAPKHGGQGALYVLLRRQPTKLLPKPEPKAKAPRRRRRRATAVKPLTK